MPHYLVPGVYFEETPGSMAPSIAALSRRSLEPAQPLRAGKATWLAEHSVAAFVGLADEGPMDTLVFVTSWDQYARQFAGASDAALLHNAVKGFFLNGGTACHVLRVASDSPDDFVGDVPDHTGLGALEACDDVSTVCVPDVMALREQWGDDGVRQVLLALVAHCERMGDRMAIIDAPPGLSAQQVKEWRTDLGLDSKFAVLYHPWLRIVSNFGYDIITVPPCGHLAGVYARTDLRRGPQHSPANELVHGVTGVAVNLLWQEQETLHPWGINPITASARDGVLVWGGRTLSSAAEWRYLSKRRLMNFIVRNIRVGTRWVIFESAKDNGLFDRITAELEGFLTLLWRTGALYGDSPEEAFVVTCDNTNNPAETIDANQVLVDCGVDMHGGGKVQFRVVYFLG